MKKGKYAWIAVAVLLLVLFIYPKLNSKQPSYNGTLPCLVPNVPVATHIHPHLVIVVDGKDETIPANLGLSSTCELPLHTHDDTGAIHVEAQVARDYKLSEFLEVYGQPIQRDGYTLKMTVDGQSSTQLGDLVMKDKQEIELSYTKITK